MERTEFLARLRCAVVAAWWCVVIGWLMLGLSWGIWMTVAGNRGLMRLVQRCWGGIPFGEMQRVWILFLGVGKMFLFVAFLGALFLTLWHGRLRRAD